MAIKTTSDDSDNSHQNSPTNVRHKIKLSILRKELRKRTEENLKLKRTVRKRNEKISKLEEELSQLSKDDVIPGEELVNLINLSKPVNEIIKRHLVKESGKALPQKYPEEIKSFAVNLNFYSPKAYEFVRCSFNNLLPHWRTISDWYKNVDAGTGFSEESFKTISVLAMNTDEQLYVNLVFDEIHIRQQVLEIYICNC